MTYDSYQNHGHKYGHLFEVVKILFVGLGLVKGVLRNWLGPLQLLPQRTALQRWAPNSASSPLALKWLDSLLVLSDGLRLVKKTLQFDMLYKIGMSI